MGEKIADIGAKLMYAVMAFMLTTLIGINIALLRDTMQRVNLHDTSIAVIEVRTEHLISAVHRVETALAKNEQVKDDQ